jgi:hypothetical protein
MPITAAPASGHNRGRTGPVVNGTAGPLAAARSDNGQRSNSVHNDGHNLLYRACFGTPAQIWSRDPHDKRELTTEFMFFALLRKGINEELPGWPEVVVVFDGQDGSAQRKETDAAYKANRPADDEALKPIRALPSVKAGLDLFAITWVEITDAEADDVIATLAASCPERDGRRHGVELSTDEGGEHFDSCHPVAATARLASRRRPGFPAGGRRSAA